MAGYACPNPDTGFPGFAFRIHQFVSRGDTVYATVEPEHIRHVTLQGQQFVPGDRGRVLLPLVFCRECGQEYYSVRMTADQEAGVRVFAQGAQPIFRPRGTRSPGFSMFLQQSRGPPTPTRCWPGSPMIGLKTIGAQPGCGHPAGKSFHAPYASRLMPAKRKLDWIVTSSPRRSGSV